MSESTIIELRDAVIRQNESIILSEVNLEVKQGEFLYVIGKVGSGKTSLIKTLYAELPLKYGKGSIAGYYLPLIKRKNVPFLRRKIGIVFQDFQLLIDRSVHHNLEFVLRATGWKNKKEIESRIITVLGKVNMESADYKMPHELSGGELQRVGIARALLNSPEIILADEPTGNLDPETSDDLVRLLKDINRAGHTVLMITHQYDLLERFPARTIKCEDGKVFEVSYNSSYMF